MVKNAFMSTKRVEEMHSIVKSCGKMYGVVCHCMLLEPELWTALQLYARTIKGIVEVAVQWTWTLYT